MTTDTTNWLVRMADERRKTLKLLARSANQSHRWAANAAGAAMSHIVAAGHALLQAQDLCEEGGWLRWLRKSFDGSVRTAQRYMRVARHLPGEQDRCDTRVASIAVLRRPSAFSIFTNTDCGLKAQVFNGPASAQAAARTYATKSAPYSPSTFSNMAKRALTAMG